MALVHQNWNGNKRKNEGEYPWREKQRLANDTYRGGDYYGHNIGSLAVDGIGEIIDFDFNHNDLFNSSVEHAESRLIRRVFSLTQIYDNWETREPKDLPRSTGYSTVLSSVTIYTSLESCSQCAGIMALGRVKDVVYLQRDPSMYLIGNILYNLTENDLKAPYPIAAENFGFEYFERLNNSYAEFKREVKNKPFHILSGKKDDKSPSITSFLCTDNALAIYEDAAKEFLSYQTNYRDYKSQDTAQPESKVLTNEQCLIHAKRFFDYAISSGQRGTPHKL
jgi:tRNA(Arg) A34 adenosine deaminase TadA